MILTDLQKSTTCKDLGSSSSFQNLNCIMVFHLEKDKCVCWCSLNESNNIVCDVVWDILDKIFWMRWTADLIFKDNIWSKINVKVIRIIFAFFTFLCLRCSEKCKIDTQQIWLIFSSNYFCWLIILNSLSAPSKIWIKKLIVCAVCFRQCYTSQGFQCCIFSDRSWTTNT